MNNWIKRISANINEVEAFIAEYSRYYEDAKNDLKMKGNLSSLAQELPALVELRYAQYEDVGYLVEYLDTRLKKIKSTYYRQYNEKNPLKLGQRDIERYIDGEDEVIDAHLILNRVTLLKSKFAGISKGLESKQYQISNITRLKVAGFDFNDLNI